MRLPQPPPITSVAFRQLLERGLIQATPVILEQIARTEHLIVKMLEGVDEEIRVLQKRRRELLSWLANGLPE